VALPSGVPTTADSVTVACPPALAKSFSKTSPVERRDKVSYSRGVPCSDFIFNVFGPGAKRWNGSWAAYITGSTRRAAGVASGVSLLLRRTAQRRFRTSNTQQDVEEAYQGSQ
jgi:hypothetical protein